MIYKYYYVSTKPVARADHHIVFLLVDLDIGLSVITNDNSTVIHQLTALIRAL